MWIERLWDRRSLRAKLLTSHLVILGIGGLATSLVGSWIVSSAIMTQMRRTLAHNLSTVRTMYDQRLQGIELTVRLTAVGPVVEHFLAVGDTTALITHLERIRRDNGLDFLTATDAAGRVIARSTRPEFSRDDASSFELVRAALEGSHVSATEVLNCQSLTNEAPRLGDACRGDGDSTAAGGGNEGIVMMAAAPLRSTGSPVSGALYGGILLNYNYEFVDDAWNVLYASEESSNDDVVGLVGILAGRRYVSTSMKGAGGERALTGFGSGAAARGPLPYAPDRIVKQKGYATAYEPIRNYAGEVVGAIHVGLLERVYTSMRNRVIMWFFVIATAGFLLIIIATDYMLRQITRPIREIVAATRHLAAGRFDQEVTVDRQGEIALLAQSFNRMARSLRQMKVDQEEWGRTLENKVHERTEQLIAMQNRVVQSEKLASLGTMAAGVAHEINNPLGGILSLTSLALEDLPEDEPARPNLEEVVRQSERCRDIVKGLLEFSRQQEAGTDSVDVRDVLDDTLALMSRQALFLNMRLTREYDPEVPSVLADRSQLQQVFMNIFMNAVQAMGAQGDLNVSVTTPDGASVEVRVSDTGCGIPEADIDKVFDPFYTTKAEGEGTGLGMSIAYGIITRHNGTISIASEVGRGTVVAVRLPASPRVATEPAL